VPAESESASWRRKRHRRYNVGTVSSTMISAMPGHLQRVPRRRPTRACSVGPDAQTEHRVSAKCKVKGVEDWVAQIPSTLRIRSRSRLAWEPQMWAPNSAAPMLSPCNKRRTKAWQNARTEQNRRGRHETGRMVIMMAKQKASPKSTQGAFQAGHSTRKERGGGRGDGTAGIATQRWSNCPAQGNNCPDVEKKRLINAPLA